MNKQTQKYLTTYAGSTLMKKHQLSDYGFWQVNGEDPNCAWGGSHHEPSIGVFEGTLESVLDRVTTMSIFWTWGAGGSVSKIIINPPKSVEEVAAEQVDIEELKKRHAEITALMKKQGLIK